MRSKHHHPYHSLKEWHAGQREKRKRERWIPYSLRWEGAGFSRILPQVCICFYLLVLTDFLTDYRLGSRCCSDLHYRALHWRQRVHALSYSVPNLRVSRQTPCASLLNSYTASKVRRRFSNHLSDAVIVQSLVGWPNPMG
jgi:hypothetical protein